jgi:osmotically-inducible protein OsmY
MCLYFHNMRLFRQGCYGGYHFFIVMHHNQHFFYMRADDENLNSGYTQQWNGSQSSRLPYSSESEGYGYAPRDRPRRENFSNQSRHQRNYRPADSRNEDRGWWERAGDEVLSWLGDDYAERRRRQDATHRGKGPKNYKRSDERISEDINNRLTDEWNIDASDIEVTVTNGDVVLTGFVADRFQKRRAADIADDVYGVTNVENRIKLNSTASWVDM